jgi:hypothetical protein
MPSKRKPRRTARHRARRRKNYERRTTKMAGRKRKDGAAGISWRRKMNERLQCKSPRCYKQRRGVGAWCTTHVGRVWRYGHPDGRSISVAEYRNEQAEVDRFLLLNSDHESVRAVEAWFKLWMDRACTGQNVPAKREMRYLYDSGVTPMEMVRAVLEISLFAARRPGKLPDDQRFRHALALSIFKLAKREQRSYRDRATGDIKSYSRVPGSTPRKDAGQYLRIGLVHFLRNAVQAMNEALAREEALELSMSKSFNQPTAGDK